MKIIRIVISGVCVVFVMNVFILMIVYVKYVDVWLGYSVFIVSLNSELNMVLMNSVGVNMLLIVLELVVVVVVIILNMRIVMSVC